LLYAGNNIDEFLWDSVEKLLHHRHILQRAAQIAEFD